MIVTFSMTSPFFPLSLPHPKQVIDLTLDSDGDNDDEDVLCSLRKPPAHTADDLTTRKKLYPWKNVPRWSKLYAKLQQQALHASTSLEKDSSGLLAGQPENSPEIPETPTVLQSTDQTVSASSLSEDGEDSPATIDVSKLTTVKVIDKRSSLSGVEYKCEFELWLAADLAERAQMGRVHIRSYENGLVRSRRFKTLRAGKRKFSEM
jgi:hypothetical protein